MKQLFSFLLFFSLFLTNEVFAQNLTVSPSGQTGTSGTNWSISNGTLTVSGGAATIQASVIENHLNNTGDLLLYINGIITVSDAIDYSGSAERTLTFISKNNLDVNQPITATNGALNVILGSNHSYNTGGVSVTDNITTNGGHFYIGGGYASTTLTWNGLTVPGGTAASYTDGRYGIYVLSNTINTGGGDIYMSGRVNYSGTSSTSRYHSLAIVDANLNAGGGDIELIGSSSGGYSNNAGIWIQANTANTSIVTSGSGSIDITGVGSDRANSSYGWRHGTAILSDNVAYDVNIQSENGDISISGEAAHTYSTNNDNIGLVFQAPSGANLSVVSKTGNITLTGKNSRDSEDVGRNALSFRVTSATSPLRIGYDGSNTYSGNITINANSIRAYYNVTGSVSAQTTGEFTLQPTDDSFTFWRTSTTTSSTIAISPLWDFGSSATALIFGKPTNTADISLESNLSFGGGLSVYGGQVTNNATLTSTATGDLFFQSNAVVNNSILFASGSSIQKTGGTGTATFKSITRANIGDINATGTGSLNVIIWTDYEGTGVRGGATFAGTANTNGGHFWVGGTATNGGSATWNGLTVGDGGSDGYYGYNYNAMDFSGTVNTNGGDVFLWAAERYSTGKVLGSTNNFINTGSGDLTIKADDIGLYSNQMNITCTGTFTWEPGTSSGWGGFQGTRLDVDGTFSGSAYSGLSDFDAFYFTDISALTGLVIGNETQDIGIRVYDNLSINGPVSIYGPYLIMSGSLTAAGDILLDADLGSQQAYDGFGIRLYNDVTATNNGSITLLGRGGNSSTGVEHGIYLDPNADLTVSGTGTITAVGQGGTSTGSECRGFVFGGSNAITSAGGAISITGYGGGSSGSNHNDGIQSAGNGNSINAGSGNITLDGGTNPFGTNGESIALDYSLTIGGTGQSGDITLIGDVFYFNSANPSSLQTTGAVTVKPYSNSFDERAISWPLSGLSLGGNETGFTLGKTQNTWDLTISSDLTIDGDINILGGAIALNGNLTASGNLNAQAKTNIALAASKTVTSTGGDILLWSDYDNDGSGAFTAGDDATFTTSGGNIYIAGGDDTDNDGFPDGFATSATSHGVQLGTTANGTTTLSTSGGTITIRGKATSSTSGVGHGVAQYGMFDVDAGAGSITINGESSSWYGIDFAEMGSSSSTPWSLVSSATSGTAVSITGTTTASAQYGVVFNYPLKKQIIADGGGSIQINGVGTGSNFGLFCQNTDFLASSSTVTLDGGEKGIKITSEGSRFGALTGSGVTSSSADVTLRGDVISVADWGSGYNTKVFTSGTVSIQPYTTNSYGNGISWPAGTALSGWDLGRTSGSGSTTFDWESITVN
jgi:hypothetical protein